MKMHKPPHPGEIVREECLEALGLSVTAAAKHLHVSRVALSKLVNERSGVSLEMAIRLSCAFGGSPEHWLRLQHQYELWKLREKARKSKSLRVKPLHAA